MRVLRAGYSGSDVTLWQQFLVGQEFLHAPVTGVYDADTIQATKDFQQFYDLDVDGTAGTFTQGQAMALGFPLLSDDESEDGPNWPAKPDARPLCNADRKRIFGQFAYVPAPTAGNQEAIRIVDGWAAESIVTVEIPQLVGVQGAPGTGKVQFHKLAADQLTALFAAWEQAGLLNRVRTWGGSWAPRFIRGSRTYLSNHCLPAQETVWTTEGPAPIADLRGYKGNVWAFEGGIAVPGKMSAFFNNGRRPLLKISMRGHVLRCTPNHPLLVLRKRALPKNEWVQHTTGRGQTRALYWTEMVRAEDLRVGDRVVATRGIPDLPTQKAVDLDWAEILGLFLGDGCVHHRNGSPEHVSFCFPEGDRVKQHVIVLLTRYFGEPPRDTTGGRALAYYKQDIFSRFAPYDHKAREKRLPPEVWGWAATAKVRLLLGLLYSDGTVGVSKSCTGTGHSARYNFKLGSKSLADGVRMLLASLGFRVGRIYEIPAEDRVIKEMPTRSEVAYSIGAVDVRGILNPDADPLYLERVASASTPDQGNTRCWGYELLMPDFTHRIVQRIEQDGDADVFDIEVDRLHNFVTGGTVVSNSWATAFDINVAWNLLGAQPALKGKNGSVRELVSLAFDHGFYWGGWFGGPYNPSGRADGMHFEVYAVK